MENEGIVFNGAEQSDIVGAAQSEPMPTRFWQNRRGIALFVAFVLVFAAIGGYTLAYLQMQSSTVENDLLLAEAAVEISNSNGISFINSGDTNGDGEQRNVAVYIRVAVTGNWTVNDSNENPTKVYAKTPAVRGEDYYLYYNDYKDTVDSYNGYNTDSWFQVVENGITYYYHMAMVKPNQPTATLCTGYEFVGTAPDGYSGTVEFAVQAIQAVGGITAEDGTVTPAVTDAWGIEVVNGILQNPNS